MGAGWWQSAHQIQLTPPNSAAPSEQRDIGQLKASVENLRRQIDMDRALIARERERPAPITDTTAHADSPAPPSAVEEERREEPVTGVEIIAELDESFSDETVDAAWSRTASSQASDALTSHLTPGSRLTQLECRADLCRVETRHPTLDQYQEFANASFMTADSGLWNGGFSSWVVEQTSDEVVAISYIAKEGHAIPVADAVVEN
jgi:hypothetical protein